MGITCQFHSDSLAMPAMDIWLVIWARYIKYILHPETDHDLMWPMTITYGISVNEECLLPSAQLREYHGTKIYIEASVARNSLQESILRSGSNIKNTISMLFVRFDVRIYLIRVYRSYPYCTK